VEGGEGKRRSYSDLEQVPERVEERRGDQRWWRGERVEERRGDRRWWRGERVVLPGDDKQP